MIFPPLILILMLGLFLLTLFLLPLLWLGVVGNAFINLGLTPGVVFWLLILTLLGSMVNIPLVTMKGPETTAGQVISYFGMQVRLPGGGTPQHTTLAVNVGGALIPAALSLYLFMRITDKIGISWGLLIVLGIVTMVMHQLARPVQGLGIAVPGLVPPLVAPRWGPGFCVRRPSAPLAPTSPAPWGHSSAPICSTCRRSPKWGPR